MYQLTKNPDIVILIENGASIPRGHRWFNDYETWLAAGGVPLTVETDEELRQGMVTKINTWRDQQEAAGFVFGHAEHTWDGGVAVATRLQNSVKMPWLPAGFYWTDANNVDVPMTLEQLQQLIAAHDQAIFNQGFRIHDRQRTMKAEVEKLSGEALAGFVVGWPA
ncbi:DUF4376 domain-containing protein [Deefgea piscis]|uniref:DUF4376 domain-containing protein n=1 Tax=Deefgea piscis TaxID=2739061 RepID=UPI001C808901|nr:DUF4376 domain-containing protein [Deefgea piscis]QZA80227.1 DUF4376 domain-containing protein [Deefgea piscis]